MNLKPVFLALLLAAPLVASSSTTAAAPVVSVTMSADTYSAASTLLGDAPVATVSVTDEEGNPLAGAEVRVVFIRRADFIGFISNETIMAETGDDGVATVSAGQLSSLPGDYLVLGYAVGTVGSDRYAIGV